jgi:hypothetical protein
MILQKRISVDTAAGRRKHKLADLSGRLRCSTSTRRLPCVGTLQECASGTSSECRAVSKRFVIFSANTACMQSASETFSSW